MLDWFGTAAVTILPGALTIALGALIVWGVKFLWDRLVVKRPDFVLSKMGSEWRVDRTRRRIAYNVVYGIGSMGGSSSSFLHNGAFGSSLGDMAQGDRQSLMLNVEPSEHGLPVWFAWIDRKRKYTQSVDLAQGDRFELVGILPRKDGSVQT